MECFFQSPSVREKAFFGFDWQFALTDSRDFPTDDAPWRAVQLPHDWSVDYPVDESAPSCGSGGYARTGIGWYRRAFSASVSSDSRYTLLFDGVFMNCDVWLNGR
ncbi:MAG: sugar-binding domain-containing protein, partial [Aristaeellaceae bacterium]